MTTTRIFLAIGFSLSVWLTPAFAQEAYPKRSVQIVNPYPAGSTTDILARALAEGLTARLGQQFVILNRPGAGGALGTASVVRGDADGYTLLFAPALVVSLLPMLRNDTGYEPNALTPVCQTFTNAMVIAVRDESPFKTLKDLIDTTKKAPGSVTYGHQGRGTIPHLAMEQFLQSSGLKIRDIPYRGDPPVVTDLLGGQIDVAALVIGAANNSKLRVLGIFASERNPTMPDVPTVKEQGYDVSPGSFGGLFAPLDTPKDVIAKLATACEGAAQDGIYATAAKRAAQPTHYFADAATFRKNLQADTAEKKKVIDALDQKLKQD